MRATGIIKNGKVVLPPDAHFAEGQRVEITSAPVSPEEAFVLRETAYAPPAVQDLPDDLSVNLDYYLHGHDRKQQPRRGRWIPADKHTPELTRQQAADITNKFLGLARETSHLPPDLSANR